MKVKVTFWTSTGKWYSDCEIDVTKESAHDGTLYEQVMEKQTAITKSLIGAYYITVDNVDDDEGFNKRLFFPKSSLQPRQPVPIRLLGPDDQLDKARNNNG